MARQVPVAGLSDRHRERLYRLVRGKAPLRDRLSLTLIPALLVARLIRVVGVLLVTAVCCGSYQLRWHPVLLRDARAHGAAGHLSGGNWAPMVMSDPTFGIPLPVPRLCRVDHLVCSDPSDRVSLTTRNLQFKIEQNVNILSNRYVQRTQYHVEFHLSHRGIPPRGLHAARRGFGPGSCCHR